MHASAGHSEKEKCDKSKICLFHPIPTVSAAGRPLAGRRKGRVKFVRNIKENGPRKDKEICTEFFHLVAICISERVC